MTMSSAGGNIKSPLFYPITFEPVMSVHINKHASNYINSNIIIIIVCVCVCVVYVRLDVCMRSSMRACVRGSARTCI